MLRDVGDQLFVASGDSWGSALEKQATINVTTINVTGCGVQGRHKVRQFQTDSISFCEHSL